MRPASKTMNPLDYSNYQTDLYHGAITKRCCIQNCVFHNVTELEANQMGMLLHSFPSVGTMQTIWMTSTGMRHYSGKNFVCSRHFDENDYERHPKTGVKCLKISAYPHINLPTGISVEELDQAEPEPPEQLDVEIDQSDMMFEEEIEIRYEEGYSGSYEPKPKYRKKHYNTSAKRARDAKAEKAKIKALANLIRSHIPPAEAPPDSTPAQRRGSVEIVEDEVPTVEVEDSDDEANQTAVSNNQQTNITNGDLEQQNSSVALPPVVPTIESENLDNVNQRMIFIKQLSLSYDMASGLLKVINEIEQTLPDLSQAAAHQMKLDNQIKDKLEDPTMFIKYMHLLKGLNALKHLVLTIHRILLKIFNICAVPKIRPVFWGRIFSLYGQVVASAIKMQNYTANVINNFRVVQLFDGNTNCTDNFYSQSRQVRIQVSTVAKMIETFNETKFENLDQLPSWEKNDETSVDTTTGKIIYLCLINFLLKNILFL